MDNQHDSYSPLGQNVDEKDYATPNLTADSGRIPEPNFVPPSFSTKKDFFAEDDGKSAKEPDSDPSAGKMPPTSKAQHVEREPLDPGYNELSNKEKRRGAEAMANSFIQGYSILCKQGAKWVMIKPSKVEKLIHEGKIDPNELYYAPGGVQATAPDIINTYNSEMSDIVEVSPEFEEQVRPLLIRIFQKRGIGMTDEQQLMWIVGQDVIMKATLLVQIKKQSAEFLKSFTKANNIQNTTPPPAVSTVHATVSEPSTEPEPAPTTRMADEDIPQRATVIEPDTPRMKVSTPKKEAKAPVSGKKSAPGKVSPALSESAPENFFDPVNLDDKFSGLSFGNKDILDGIEAVAQHSKNISKPKPKAKPKAKKK